MKFLPIPKYCYSITHLSMPRSGERESLLTREIEDLKSKLKTKADELNEAIKRNSEVCTCTVHEIEKKP